MMRNGSQRNNSKDDLSMSTSTDNALCSIDAGRGQSNGGTHGNISFLTTGKRQFGQNTQLPVIHEQNNNLEETNYLEDTKNYLEESKHSTEKVDTQSPYAYKNTTRTTFNNQAMIDRRNLLSSN